MTNKPNITPEELAALRQEMEAQAARHSRVQPTPAPSVEDALQAATPGPVESLDSLGARVYGNYTPSGEAYAGTTTDGGLFSGTPGAYQAGPGDLDSIGARIFPGR
jgi:hypothetical protein